MRKRPWTCSPQLSDMGSLAIATQKKDDAGLKLPGVRMPAGNIVGGRYRVEKSLGVGPFGYVLAAQSLHGRRRVALKVLTAATSMSSARRALATAHRSAALKSEHIARVVDTGFTEDGLGFIATERLAGHTLADEMATRGSLPAWKAVQWILEACEGLAEAHAQGIVHGDLKPSNLFLAGDVGGSSAEARTLKILDFGIALMPFGEDDGNDVDSFEHSSAATAPLFASPAYLAPERLHDSASRLDSRVDIWSLGVILHQLIAGSLPFMADTVSGMLVAVAYDAPALLAAPDVSYELARVVHACLAKDPSKRPRNVATLAKMLAPFAGPTGKHLADRVLESARSAAPPPPPAEIAGMTVSLPPMRTEPRFTQTLKGMAPFAMPSSAPAATAAAAAKRPSFAEGLDSRAQRRRKIAIATVCGAAVLAVIGFLVPTAASLPDSVSSTTSIRSGEMATAGSEGRTSATDDAAFVVERSTAEQALPLRAFVPPSFGSAEREVESVESLPTVAPPPPNPYPVAAAAAAPSPLPPRMTSLPPTLPMPSSAKPATPPSNAKAKGGLMVREDPYGKGFTHPTRLTDRRK